MDEAAERNEGWSENCLGSGRGGVWGHLHPQQERYPGTPVFHFTQVTEKLIVTLRASEHSLCFWDTSGSDCVPTGWLGPKEIQHWSSRDASFTALSFTSSSSAFPCMLHSSSDKIRPLSVCQADYSPLCHVCDKSVWHHLRKSLRARKHQQ